MLRDAKTPSAHELDDDAQPTLADIDRAARSFRHVILMRSARPALRFLLDATTDNAGHALGPLPDD